METEETLYTTLKDPSFQSFRDSINRKMLGIQMLASIQANLLDDIERTLNQHGKFRYEVKINIKNLRREIEKNVKNEVFFGKMSVEQKDAHMRAYEPLEKMVYDYLDSDEISTPTKG